MFFGFFVLIAGLFILLERLGVINPDVHWGLPLALICWGASEIRNSVIAKKNKEETLEASESAPQ